MEACENCGQPIGSLETPHVWNERVVCAACHQRLSGVGAGAPQVTIYNAVGGTPAVPDGYPPSGITAPLVISAVANILVGLAWAVLGFVCFGWVLSIFMWILCVFEFSLYIKADHLSPVALSGRSKVIAVCEIIIGLFNTPTLICGIIQLVSASRLADSVRQSRRGSAGFDVSALDRIK